MTTPTATVQDLKQLLDQLNVQSIDVPISVFVRNGSASPERLFSHASYTSTSIITLDLDKVLAGQSTEITLNPEADKGMLLRFLNELSKLITASA